MPPGEYEEEGEEEVKVSLLEQRVRKERVGRWSIILCITNIFLLPLVPIIFNPPISFYTLKRDVRERKKNLLRYTPDVARAIAVVLNGINKRKRMVQGELVEEDDGGGRGKQPQRPKDAKQLKLYVEMERKWAAAAGGGSSSLLGLLGEAEDLATFDVRMLCFGLMEALIDLGLSLVIESIYLSADFSHQSYKPNPNDYKD